MGKDQLVEIQVPDLAAVQARMGRMMYKAPTAMRTAINKTITHVNKLMAQEARKEYIVKPGAVKKTIKVKKATVSHLTASATSKTSDRIKLVGFQMNPAKKPQSPPAYYKARAKQKSSLKALPGSGDRSSAFIAQMSSGHVGAFQRMLGTTRKGGKRNGRKRDEKLAEMTGLAIPSMLGSKTLSDEIQKDGQSFMDRALDQEIKRYLEMSA